jgi:hypothetical protein
MDGTRQASENTAEHRAYFQAAAENPWTKNNDVGFNTLPSPPATPLVQPMYRDEDSPAPARSESRTAPPAPFHSPMSHHHFADNSEMANSRVFPDQNRAATAFHPEDKAVVDSHAFPSQPAFTHDNPSSSENSSSNDKPYSGLQHSKSREGEDFSQFRSRLY